LYDLDEASMEDESLIAGDFPSFEPSTAG